MSKSLVFPGHLIFAYADRLHGANLLEEPPDSALLSLGVQASTEHGVRHTGFSRHLYFLYENEINLEFRSLEYGSVGASPGLNCFLVSSKLDKGYSVADDMLAFDECAVCREEGAKAGFFRVFAEVFHLELCFALVFLAFH